VQGRIHWVVSAARDAASLAAELVTELHALVAAPAARRDTTLLVVPACLRSFLDFNDFVGVAEDLVAEEGLEGVIQIASFHPRYRFAGTAVRDITNATNRAPYPTLHLLREASVERAVRAFPDASTIYERNMDSLRALGPAGWAELGVGATPVTAAASPRQAMRRRPSS
jgi:hypothetical protein